MAHRLRGLVFGLVLALVCASEVLGAGFGIYEWGARSMALGGAMAARADDPSALACNPAGITQLEGFQFMTGMTFIAPQATVNMQDPYGSGSMSQDANDLVWYVPHMYATYKLNEKVAFGLGIFSRFGLGNDYDDQWWGRYNTTHTSLTSLSINPTVAWNVTDAWSMSFGLEIIRMDVNMHQAVDGTRLVYGALGNTIGSLWLLGQGLGTEINDPRTNDLDITQELEGSGYGLGGVIGMRYKLSEEWTAGIVYRSRMSTKIEGTARFKLSERASSYLQPFTNANQQLFRETDVSTTITTPDSVHFGLLYSPSEALSVEAGVIFTAWSTYDELVVDYEYPSLGTQRAVSEKYWNDTWRFNLGVEYLPVNWLALRAGYVYDQSPIEKGLEDYALPANDRQLFSGGLGFAFGDFSLDLAYTYLDIIDRDVNARPDDGFYAGSFTNGCAHLFAASLGYKF